MALAVLEQCDSCTVSGNNMKIKVVHNSKKQPTVSLKAVPINTRVIKDSSLMSVAGIKRLLGIPQDRRSDVVVITPVVAKQLLDYTNVRNRTLRQGRVDLYKNFLINNQWHLTPDALAFTKDGVLANAQHRLEGVVKSGIAAEFLVVFDIELSSAIDTGAKRSYHDNVKISENCDERLRDDKALQSIFRLALIYQRGNCNSQLQNLPDTVTEYMNSYANELLKCKEDGIFDKLTAPNCNNVAVKAAFFLARLNGVELDVIKHIISVLNSGIADGDKDAPIIGLRDKLMCTQGAGRELIRLRIGYVHSCILKLNQGKKTKRLDPSVMLTYDF